MSASLIADDSFDRYARLVRNAVGVPVALVSVVEDYRQVFPGAVGLPEPWQHTRETPLTHSFCQHVAAARRPLVISDARRDPRVVENYLAIEDLHVIAYAGYPITDGRGQVIGALCAIDDAPRQWRAEQLATLEDLAAACSTELAFRETRQRARQAEYAATVSEQHTQGLLALSEGLAGALDLPEVALALELAAQKALHVTHAGIWVLDADDEAFRYLRHPKLTWRQAERRSTLSLDADSVIVDAALSGQLMMFSDEAERVGRYPSSASQTDEETIAATAYIPLISAGERLGTLALTWSEPRAFTALDRSLLQALGSYAARAVERAHLIEHRSEVGLRLQQAMLSSLPEPDHLELRVRYVPAEDQDLVGGDWYDAIQLPGGAMLVSVGDVIGHDIDAAVKMGQIRNLFRGLAWNHPDQPAELIHRLDRTLAGLHAGIITTLVACRIEQNDEDKQRGLRTLRWTNAGHPPPILIEADGRARALYTDTTDPLLGVAPDQQRREHTVHPNPDSTLLLYTDGLVETRERDIDEDIQRLLDSINSHPGLELNDLLDALINDLVSGAPDDDLALLAIRFHAETQPRPLEAGPSTD